MQYSEVQGLKLSRFTLGTVQLGMPYGMNNVTGQPSFDEAARILAAARLGGVNALDTAAQYGCSETVIGRYLASNPDAFPVLCTKFKLSGDDPAQEIRQSLDGSLARLGIPFAPVYLLHTPSQMTDYGDAVPDTLAKLREEKKIGVAGVSVYTPEETETFLKHPVYGAIQVPMGLLDTRLVRLGLIDELKARGIAVFVRSVYTQGLVLMDTLPEKYVCARKCVETLRDIARSEGVTIKQLAVSFIRDLPGVSSLVLGCETEEQVFENLRLMDGPALSAQARDAVMHLNAPTEQIMRAIQGK